MLKWKLWKTMALVSLLCLFVNTWLHWTKNGIEVCNEPKLKIAVVIFRHGDRNPMETFPTDPNKNVVWPEGWGKLTRIGVEQLYRLGTYIRRRYASLLADVRNPSDVVHVQSSNLHRTLRSAAVCLAGLFPSKNDQIWNEDISWQSIPINTLPKKNDYMLSPGNKCPRYDRAFDEYLESPEFTALMTKHERLFRELEKQSGMEIRAFSDAKRLYDILWIERLKNKTLPTWGVEALENDDFKWVADHTYQIRSNTTILARLYSGFLIRQIVEYLQQKVDGSLSPNRSLFMYSVSGYVIAKVLNALRLFDSHDPPYASSLHFEVYSMNDEHYMQIIYRNTDEENPKPLEIPSCGAKCTLEKFKSIYNAVIPTGTFDEECRDS